MSLPDDHRLNQDRNGRFGPHVKAVAKILFMNLGLCPHVLEVLKQIDAAHPALSFADFVDAARLAEIIEREKNAAIQADVAARREVRS